MKKNLSTKKIGVAVMLLFTVVGSFKASATSQSDQVAIQLGAIQLGYSGSVSLLTSQQQANALTQGNLALAATTANYSASVSAGKFVTNATCPNPQSSTFRVQLYTATVNALQYPVTNLSGISKLTVTYASGKTTIVTADLNPTKTTPDLVAGVSTAKVPNYGSSFASNAVAASLACTTNTNGIVFPVWGVQPSSANVTKYANNSYALNVTTQKAQLATAGKAASAAMTAALKVYATGTV
ncbi:MAG: hypothetical protein WCP41_08940, partial [Verrucomicrobiota bacterium]